MIWEISSSVTRSKFSLNKSENGVRNGRVDHDSCQEIATRSKYPYNKIINLTEAFKSKFGKIENKVAEYENERSKEHKELASQVVQIDCCYLLLMR